MKYTTLNNDRKKYKMKLKTFTYIDEIMIRQGLE